MLFQIDNAEYAKGEIALIAAEAAVYWHNTSTDCRGERMHYEVLCIFLLGIALQVSKIQVKA